MTTPPRRPHALVIEDELISGLALQLQLADLGFRSFAFAGTEYQAVEQARLCWPDLVTVDIGLLDGTGLGAIESILGICGPTPVVFVTGDRVLVDLADALIVEKPVDVERLEAAVRQAQSAPMPVGAWARANADARRAVI
jgi:CheY-like chemotaxis protein